jgi:polysaccharide pyruvyl transferase WcaK-like protein
MFKSEYIIVLMARAARNKVCEYGPCANKLVSTHFFDKHHRILRKEVTVVRSPASFQLVKEAAKKKELKVVRPMELHTYKNILKL